MIHFGTNGYEFASAGDSRTRGIVFLPIAGGTGAAAASLATDQEAGASGFDGTRPQLWKALCERGASIDRSGAIPERFAVASVLRHPLGTTGDGAARLEISSIAGSPGLPRRIPCGTRRRLRRTANGCS